MHSFVFMLPPFNTVILSMGYAKLLYPNFKKKYDFLRLLLS